MIFMFLLLLLICVLFKQLTDVTVMIGLIRNIKHSLS